MRDSAFVKDYHIAFIDVGHWGGTFEHSDINLNDIAIIRLTEVPNFVKEFEENLDKERISANVRCFLRLSKCD